MLIFQIAIIALICSVIVIILRQQRPDLAVLASIAGGVILFVLLIDSFTDIFDWFDEVFEKTGIQKQIFSPVLKIVGIGYIAEFSASICEESGNKALASKVVLGAKVIILVMSLPILSALLDTIVSVV